MKQLGATTTSEATMVTSAGTVATAPNAATQNILDLDASPVTNSNSYTEQVLLYVLLLFHLLLTIATAYNHYV